MTLTKRIVDIDAVMAHFTGATGRQSSRNNLEKQDISLRRLQFRECRHIVASHKENRFLRYPQLKERGFKMKKKVIFVVVCALTISLGQWSGALTTEAEAGIFKTKEEKAQIAEEKARKDQAKAEEKARKDQAKAEEKARKEQEKAEKKAQKEWEKAEAKRLKEEREAWESSEEGQAAAKQRKKEHARESLGLNKDGTLKGGKFKMGRF